MENSQLAAALQLALHRQLLGKVAVGEQFAAAISLDEIIAAFRELYPDDDILEERLFRKLVEFLNESMNMSMPFSLPSIV